MKKAELNNTIKFNIGLDVGTDKNALTAYAVKGAVIKHLSQPRSMTGARIVSFHFAPASTDEVTLVLTAKTSLNEEQSIAAVQAMARDLQQVAIAYQFNGTGHLVYATELDANNADYGTAFDSEYWLD